MTRAADARLGLYEILVMTCFGRLCNVFIEPPVSCPRRSRAMPCPNTSPQRTRARPSLAKDARERVIIPPAVKPSCRTPKSVRPDPMTHQHRSPRGILVAMTQRGREVAECGDIDLPRSDWPIGSTTPTESNRLILDGRKDQRRVAKDDAHRRNSYRSAVRGCYRVVAAVQP